MEKEKLNINEKGKVICPICEDEIISLDYTHTEYERGEYTSKRDYDSTDTEDTDTTYRCPSCGYILLENGEPDDILDGKVEISDYKDERREYELEMQRVKNKQPSPKILSLCQTDIDLITITDMQREIKADNVDKIAEQLFIILDKEGFCGIYSQVDTHTGDRGYKKGYIPNAISYAIAKKI